MGGTAVYSSTYCMPFDTLNEWGLSVGRNESEGIVIDTEKKRVKINN